MTFKKKMFTIKLFFLVYLFIPNIYNITEYHTNNIYIYICISNIII